jgi:signal transduction histidine kinase
MSGGGDDEGFVSRIAHELRTPLAVLMGYAQLLPLRGDDPEFRLQASEHIQEAVERLSRAVDAVILSTAVDAGELTLDLRPRDLGAVLTSATRNRNVVLECRDASGWPSVTADAQSVAAIVDLLLGDDSRISAETDGDVAAITVATTGKGPSAFGLYAARRLAELHGGTLVPGGPTFTLPLAQA